MDPEGMTNVWTTKTRISPTSNPAATTVTARRRARVLPVSVRTPWADTTTRVRDVAESARVQDAARLSGREPTPASP